MQLVETDQDKSAPPAKTSGLLNPENSEVATMEERNVAFGCGKVASKVTLRKANVAVSMAHMS